MIERVKHTKDQPEVAPERVTVLDDRLLHMTRDEAKAYLDAYLQERGLASEGQTAKDELTQEGKRPVRRPSARRAQP